MKIVALGINTKTNKCCLIESKATFEQLEQDFELYAKTYKGTNWGGQDDIARTLSLCEGLTLGDKSFFATGKNIGADYEQGCAEGGSKYCFTFDKVVEIITG